MLASPALAADKLTVLLDWYVNPDHAPLVIAKEGGYFARHDLDVDLVVSSDASAPPKLVAAGKADVAITYQPDLMLQIKEGLPIVRFGTLIDTPLNCLIVLKDGPIKSLADLKGKTVGYSVAELPGRLPRRDPEDRRAVLKGREDGQPQLQSDPAAARRPGRRGHGRLSQRRADPARIGGPSRRPRGSRRKTACPATTS